MIKEKFTMKIENEEVIDRKALCVAVKDSAKEGTTYCSLLKDELTICNKCPLLFICDGIDMLEADYIQETENTVKVFEVEGR
ncbi:conserved hypothetical protein [Clostridium neonatale]|uniref:hypothetical protein n=1 Tax=Clostridium neonatale TaxID=137838 RepID=UPI00291B905B|nr:hypothetical protein [Clostridium neonatale]CAI3238686.1 conserved hypothetical protein [Clostridium neonatale]CAI3539724.1 conserved hypothetical protein [Clostridium neonatale]